MSFPVVFAEPACWDQAQLTDILDHLGGTLYRVDEIGQLDGAALVVPARYYDAETVNAWLRPLAWAVVFLVSDEESTFAHHELRHPRMRLWVMTPRPGQHDLAGRYLPHGLPPGTTETLAELTSPGAERPVDWFFAGQLNHHRRLRCVQALRRTPGGALLVTQGFTQGLERRQYLRQLAAAKIAPSPSGPATADCFRGWEALEAGCVPIVDASCPSYGPGYWQLLLGDDPPFPVVDDWLALLDIIPELLAGWPANANRCWAWWQQWKRGLAHRIADDVEALSGRCPPRSLITALVPTSPITTHPSTDIIEETIASIRHHHPGIEADIIVMCDGVRPEQEHRRADYEEYLRRVMWLCQHRWNATPLIFDDHQHQANMTRRALEFVRSPLVLFVEHDTPLVTDEPIDWSAAACAITSGQLDLVRFHYEGRIHPEHRYLMLDDKPTQIGKLPVVRTRQWSQRPHLAGTDYYRRIIDRHFPETCRTLIEDRMHGVAQDEPWLAHRLAVYAPGENLKRSTNLDGRGAESKYEMRFA